MPKNAMFIDDDEAYLMLVERVCRKNIGLQGSSFFTTGEDAIFNLRESIQKGLYPDFIFIDINMPAMNGYELIHELIRIKQENSSQKKFPKIVMLTTSNDEKDIKLAFDCGVSSYIVKPSRLTELSEKLTMLLSA